MDAENLFSVHVTTNRLILPLIINIECDWSLNLISFVRIGSDGFEDKHVNTFKTGFITHVHSEGFFPRKFYGIDFSPKAEFLFAERKMSQ